MSEWLLTQLASFGPALLFIITMLSCLAVPMPASLAMMTTGAFVATGDVSGPTAAASALAGALLGDQTGFVLGRRARDPLTRALATRPKRARLFNRAFDLLNRNAGFGVYLSRWLLSPLGPYVNLAAGAAAMNWPRFTLWAALGELTWVSLYIGLGYAFAGNLAAAAEFAADTSGLIAALAVMLGAGLWLRHALRLHREDARERQDLGGSDTP